MEVRGGTGYIEEWSDARLVRDAHLGSIWEGTSNIVALDIARAVQRAGALEPLCDHLLGLLEEAALPSSSKVLLRKVLGRAAEALTQAAKNQQDELVRQAGSALYHATTAIFMAHEAARLAPDFRRLALSHLVLRHKLLPVDPLALEADGEHAEIYASLVHERAVTLGDALQLLPQ